MMNRAILFRLPQCHKSTTSPMNVSAKFKMIADY
jgi:hypothetical protein